MTATQKTARLTRLDATIATLYAELDAMPSDLHDGDPAQYRLSTAKRLTAEREALSLVSTDDPTPDGWESIEAGAETPASDFSGDRRMRFLVSRFYDIVTPDSAIDGDIAESGTVAHNEEMDVRETVEQLREMHCTSTYPIRSVESCKGTWAFTNEDYDLSTGESRTESVHVKHLDGSPLSARQLFRLYRAAGLLSIAIVA